MIKEWIDKDKCTGCAACANICPKNAIDMKKDRYGFVHPVIASQCIDCGQCAQVCNSRTVKWNEPNYAARVYAAWSKDEDIRFKSTSGGIFSELALTVLNQKGIVAGAEYGNDNLVYHVAVKDEAGLEKIRQSKYIQSEIGFVFKEIKHYLSEDTTVLFCGTPCQVAGLRAYLKRDYENLITIDFVCRGVNSPKAYQAWLKEIEIKKQKRIKRVWFKYKEGGWKSSPTRTRIDFTNGDYQIFEGQDNAFMCGYLGPNLYIRPSCGTCEFKSEKRVSDITVGDFWGIKSEYDDDKGTSLLMVNSAKGQAWFEKTLPRIEHYQCTLDDVVRGNACFTSSVSINLDSEKFLKELDNKPFSKCLSRCSTQRLSVLRRIVRKLKAYM